MKRGRKEAGSRTREGVGMARKSASIPARIEQGTKGQNRAWAQGHNGTPSVNYSEWHTDSESILYHPPSPTSHISILLHSSLFIRTQLWLLSPANTPLQKASVTTSLWRPLHQHAPPLPQSPSILFLLYGTCAAPAAALPYRLPGEVRNLLSFSATSRLAKSQEHCPTS